MNFISLFTGIGGIDLGLEWAGMTCVGQVEIHPICRVFLERHFPGIPKWKDIRNFDRRLWRNYYAPDAPNVDLVAGGFPCQDISTAGKGAGLAGKRSGLWKEFYRVIKEFGPNWVLIENVSALRTRGADRVLHDLDRAGYTTWPIVVGAWAAGAVHPRNRVWIMAYANEASAALKISTRRNVFAQGSGTMEDSQKYRVQGRTISAGSGAKGKGATHADGTGKMLGNAGRTRLQKRWKIPIGTEPLQSMSTGVSLHGRIAPMGCPQREGEEPRLVELKVGGTVDGLRPRVAEWCNMEALAAYGNAVVPQIVQAIGESIKRIEEVIHG